MTLLAAVLVLTSCSGGDGASTDAVSRPAVVSGAFRCPDPKVESPRDHGADRLRTGATAALLCYRATDGFWTAPNGALTEGVDDLVALVNSRRPRHFDACNALGGPAWSMVLRYPDGIRTIEGDDGGCGTFFVGPTEEAGAPRVWATFLAALGAQRRAADPPGSTVRPTGCPARLENAPLSVVAQPDRAAAATWCVPHGRRWVSAGRVSEVQLRVLRRAFRPPYDDTSLGGHRDCHGLPRTTYGLLSGRDAWGEPFAIPLFCDLSRIFPAGSPRADFVVMTPAMRRLVARSVTHPALRP